MMGLAFDVGRMLITAGTQTIVPNLTTTHVHG